MSDMSWIHNPQLNSLHPIKRQIITELVQEAEGKNINQAMPLLMKANTKLKQEGMTFNTEETALIMELLTKDMTPEEKARVESMKQMILKMKPK
jgi:hypothetical protein